MEAIGTVILYDQDAYHASASRDQSTAIVFSIEDLLNCLAAEPRIHRNVGICSHDKSKAIDEIVHLPQVASISLCQKHGNHGEDPAYGTKVRGEIRFNWDKDDLVNLEYRGHMDNQEQCLLFNNPEQYEFEAQASKRIKIESRYRSRNPQQPEEPHVTLSSDEISTSTEAKK